MYTEEPKRINWADIVKKGVILLVIIGIIFLIIWLFTRNNGNNIDVDYGNDNNSNITDNSAYSESFINNYRYFHDTAKEYFLISELPENGKTIKYTLQELIDKGLILNFSYKNGSCDSEASYVYVTNNNGKYTMTTTLVCEKEVAKTTEELGCNQLCNDKTCTKEEEKVETTTLGYQYKQAYQATETVYTCPSGYTKTGTGSNTKCIKNDSSSIKATKKVSYTCPDGYDKSGMGSSTKCTKKNNQTINATEVIEYICKDGYTKTGEGENTKCYKNNNSTINAKYTLKYTCPDGYNQTGEGENTKCTKSVTKTINANANTTYSCSEGSLSGTNCKISYTYNTNASSYYYCNYGKITGSQCKVNYTNKYYETYTTYKGKTYNGCSYSGSYNASCSSYKGCTRTNYKYYCSKSAYYYTNASVGYRCSSGDLSGTQCVHSATKTVAATAHTSYTCSEGKQSSSDQTKCIVTSTESTKANTTKNYYCEDKDYTLDGTKCYKKSTETIEPTKKVTNTCPDGYNQNGNKCISTKTETKNATKKIEYTCPSGYTKEGLGSSSICTKGNTVTLNATKETKTVTKYKYQCSLEESITGWEKTGKTCKINETSSK